MDSTLRMQTGKVCGIEPDGRHVLLTDPTNRGLYRYTILTRRARLIDDGAGAGYRVSMSRKGLVRRYDHVYTIPDMPRPMGENESYLWTSVSPNGEKCLFYVPGYGAFVCNMDGNELQSVGDLHAPRWLNDHMIIAMNDEDNGMFVTRSAIVVYDISDGSRRQITDAALKLMFPYADSKGKKIACSSDDGDIYLITLR